MGFWRDHVGPVQQLLGRRLGPGTELPLVDARGPELDQGAAMPLLAQMAWYPTSLFDARAVSWSAIETDHARASLRVGHIFVLHRVPVGEPLESESVQATIRTAWKRVRVAVPSKGTHALRHTAATRLLRSGVTLKEIADVLGHRSIDTTTVYAKLDVPHLAEVALPWPAARP